jgi:hypothetical protein
LLLAILLFNWVGYRLVSYYLQQRADRSIEATINNLKYHESQLVEMRVPLNMPYQNDQPEFEPVDGEIEIDGQIYKYVKRKVEKGELVLMCLPHTNKEKLREARDDFFKMVNDLQQDSKTKKSDKGNSFSFKNFLSEYKAENNDWSVSPGLSGITHHVSRLASDLVLHNGETAGHPPQYC